MNRLVSHVEAERPIALALDKLDGPIRENVGDVTLDNSDLAVLVQFRVVRSTLTGDGDPLIESRTSGRVIAHVPLAEKGRFVAGSL